MKIKGLKRVKAKSGKVYYYDRESGKRLKSFPGTPEFFAEIAALRATPFIKNKGNKIATFGDLVRIYRNSPIYEVLQPRTKKDYLRVIDFLKPLDGVPITDFDAEYVSRIKDRAYRKHKRRFTNYVLAVISVIFNWGLEPGHTKINPTDGVKKIKRPKDARHVNRRWHDHELDTVLEHAPDHLALAVAIGAYTGLREGDAVRLPISAIKNGRIEIRQRKTGEMLELPIHPELQPYLEKSIKRKAVTVIVGQRGYSLTEAGFRANFFKMLRHLVLHAS
ncbi:MAG: hypothetical protein JKY45_00270 [Emcibacter sp.]|nr:hypothetical protein [Emcibacter sp.]